MIPDILKKAEQRIPKCRGIVLVGTDGFTVDKSIPPDSSFEQMVVEHVGVIKRIVSIMDSMDLGILFELAFIGEKINILFTAVSDSYFLALGIDPDGYVGRARYELKLAALQLRHELFT